ncbi:MAG TPA: hypothetical protein PKO15_00160 [Fibrobacteria bacterium]|nr:hypothetical protein [Fibrobacteria bacterium]
MAHRMADWKTGGCGLFLGALLLCGCPSEDSPTASTSASTIPVAKVDLDSACRSAVSLDPADSMGDGSSARNLQACLERMEGVWTLDPGASTDLETVLDSMVATYPESVRSQLRARLKSVADVSVQLEIRFEWPKLAVGSDGDRGILSRPDGVGVPFEENGEEIWLTTRWDSGRLVQVYQASDGFREDAFGLDSAGRLVLVSTTKGDGMPQPLVVTSHYLRK